MLNETHWIQQIASLAAQTDRQLAQQHGFTGLFEAQLGDGAGVAPENVLVPVGERRFPDEIYVNRITDNKREVVRVRNLNGAIPFPERSAGYWVWCGKSPGTDSMRQVLYASGKNGVAYGGEGTPLKAVLTQIQAEKLAGSIVPTSPESLSVQYIGSAFISIGGREYYPLPQTIALSSYIPGTAGKARYVHIAMDSSGTPVITAGDEFTYASETEPLNFVPTPQNANAVYRAHVYLQNGMIVITEQHIRRVPVAGFAPGTTPESETNTIFTDAEFTIQNDADPTKQAHLNASAIPTATAKTYNLPTFLASADDLVTLTATQTLTNKTLTSPTINTPTISGGTINNAVIGGTTPAAGTFTQLTVSSGGNTQVTISSLGAVVFNEQGNAADFRIEADTDANMFFVQGSTNRIGVGLNTPQSKFHLVGTTDEIQFRVVGVSGQTQPLADIQDGNAASVFGLSAAGVLTVTNRTALTNTFNTAFLLQHNTSGTPAAGFGVRFAIRAESSTTENREQFVLTTSWVVATDASRTGRAVFGAFDTAHRECIRIEASGTAPMLGFYGSAAVAKQAVSGSRGGNAALASVLTALATLGLITDSSTA